jgi:hypothetical protein
MPTPRNFEQLLIVKQLYQDSDLLINKGDIFSLSKAVIFLDLSIELTLKTILLNLNPNFLSQLFQQPQIKVTQKQHVDISWHIAWTQASKELQAINKSSLSEEAESRNLRNSRNGIQHNGQTPATQDVKRYLASTTRMLKDAFHSAFDLDFENLRSWDFIQNKDLKQLLKESEDFLNQKITNCLFGCIWALHLIKEEIQSKKIYFHLNANDDLRHYNQFITERFNNLEIEILLVGMGMSIIDTRRFLYYQKIFSDFQEEPTLSLKASFTIESLEEDILEAKFMLNYLFRLLRFIEDNQPEILENITIKIPLSKQKFATN